MPREITELLSAASATIPFLRLLPRIEDDYFPCVIGVQGGDAAGHWHTARWSIHGKEAEALAR
jgi:hypothetical protein